jgi:hypothetical protein
MERRIRLGELLIRAGLISELQLNAALAEQKKWGGRLGRILVDMKFLSEDMLVKGLAKLLALPRADLSHIDVPDLILQKFDAGDCQSRGYLPVQYIASEKKLVVAMVEAKDLNLIDDLRFKHGLNIQPAVVGEHALIQAINALFYGTSVPHSSPSVEPGMKLVDNQGTTLVKNREQIAAEHVAKMQQKQATVTAVERPASQPGMARVPDVGAQLSELEAAQRRQARAIKSLVELLIEGGVFSREDFMAAVSRRCEDG